MSTEYTTSSKAIECGSKGRTMPLLSLWLGSALFDPPELAA